MKLHINIDKVLAEIFESEYPYSTKDKDDYYHYEIYVDYRDELGDDTIKKICSSTDPMSEFYEQFEEYDMYDYQMVYKVLKSGIRDYKDEHGEFEDEIDISEWLCENVLFDFDYKHFLKQDVCVDFFVDTGDGDYDYTCNNILNYYGDVDDIIMNESSILWLIKQQGYSKTDLNNLVRKEDDKGSKFLDSIYHELANASSSMNTLTFLVKMTLGDYLEYLENPYKITVSKDTTCGLVDFWQGGGSLLEVQLDNAVTLNTKISIPRIDGQNGYGIKEIYGTNSSLWGRAITHQQP